MHQDNRLNVLLGCVKLPRPKLRMITYAQTLQSTLRATQEINVQREMSSSCIINALSREYDVTI